MRHSAPAAVLACLLTCGVPVRAAAAGDRGSVDLVQASTVKIFVTFQRPDYYQPWQTTPQDSLSGSGVVIPGRRILTNAHVVSDQTFVQVRRPGDGRKYRAHVEFVGHDTELAVLTVEDPSFFDGLRPVPFGDLPRHRDRVAAYGFPTGGDELSITEGVVSRIEVVEYVHSSWMLLAVQTDAAINPGNSGGPVVKDGKLVGVSFQTMKGQDVENIGYFVPIPLIRRFLKDVQDGRYDGVPNLGLVTQDMENPDLRRLHGLGPDQSGVLVKKVMYGSSGWGIVREGDVLTAVDGVPISDDGTYAFERDKRLSFFHLITMKQLGEDLGLDVIREGRPMHLAVRLKEFTDLVSGPHYDVKPTYFVYAGMVFTPLTRNYINIWSGDDVATSFKFMEELGYPSERRQQPVVLSYVLPDDVTAGYHDFRGLIIDSVNGVVLHDMKDLVRAFEKPVGGFHVLRTDDLTDEGGWIVLDAERSAKAHPGILARNGIPSDRSDDLRLLPAASAAPK